jgi:metal-responsive CopG/Arc/MetJ family transcriptional regulator
MKGMAKDKVSVTLDRDVLAAADADAQATGLNRSELVEQALRHEHLRIALQSYTAETVPALDIDNYAQTIYAANRAAGL